MILTVLPIALHQFVSSPISIVTMTSPDTKDSDSGSIRHNMPSLHQVQSVTITNEMFEKLYLSPANRVKGDLRQTFANPTPL